MYKISFIFVVFAMIAFASIKAQIITKVYLSKFQPESVTFNGSPDPNECWESVEYGISIKTDKGFSFFTMQYEEIDKLKEKLGDSEVLIEVYYFDAPSDDSNAVGRVIKITQNAEVIYKDN